MRNPNSAGWCVDVFQTPLAWIAMIGGDRTLKNMSMGLTKDEALGGLDKSLLAMARRHAWHPELVGRLQEHITGVCHDFLDVAIEPGPRSEFGLRVIQECRQIVPGKTLTYGELAAKAGSPGAARAVGNLMARNRIPLVVPCHRVVGSGGSLCGYSGCGGIETKRALLEIEAAWLDRQQGRQTLVPDGAGVAGWKA
jgi:methylated-DNA-[protein]-cysteine S-methyltransferase